MQVPNHLTPCDSFLLTVNKVLIHVVPLSGMHVASWLSTSQ